MLRMREHVHRLYFYYVVFLFQNKQVAGLCGGVAAYVYNFLSLNFHQPVHHILYLLSVAGRRDRTKYWVHRVLGELYSPDIFPGDEDTGSMSAWYILGCLGIFSPCPGRSDWTLGSPLFPKASITFPDGRTIQIESRNSRAAAGAAHGVTVNGKPLEGNLLPHDTFRRNAHLVFED